jgi:hypothetical protein
MPVTLGGGFVMGSFASEALLSIHIFSFTWLKAPATSSTEGKAWLGLRVLFNLINIAPSS